MNPEQEPKAAEELSERDLGETAGGRIPGLEEQKPAEELNTEELKEVVGGADVGISTITTTVDTGGGLLTSQQVQQIVLGVINALNQQGKRPT